jgi:hypothetical protein
MVVTEAAALVVGGAVATVAAGETVPGGTLAVVSGANVGRELGLDEVEAAEVRCREPPEPQAVSRRPRPRAEPVMTAGAVRMTGRLRTRAPQGFR